VREDREFGIIFIVAEYSNSYPFLLNESIAFPSCQVKGRLSDDLKFGRIFLACNRSQVLQLIMLLKKHQFCLETLGNPPY